MIVFWGVLIAAGVAVFRYLARGPQEQSAQQSTTLPGQRQSLTPPSAETILAERFARGEIEEDEYHARLTTLRGATRT